MSAKVRNWLLGGLGLAVFILGIPLAQRVVASTNASAASGAKPVENSAAANEPEKATHPSIIKVGDQYLQIVPGNDGTVSAFLYDSAYKFLAGNENEATLTFTLPGGEKKIVKITAASMTCPMGGEQTSDKNSDCCTATSAAPHPDTCPVKGKTDKTTSE